MSNTVVIGGWGVSPDILRKCFSDNATFIDCNFLMSSIINNSTLRKNWVDILLDKLPLNKKDSFDLAGWSTGAICALVCAPHIRLHSLTLISPTLSFCRRNGYRHGIRSTILASMRSRLSNAESVLSQFHLTCGLKTQIPMDIPWTQTELAAGLHFLEKVDCTDIQFNYPAACIIHGTQDSIIPVEAAYTVAEKIDSRVHLFEGEHAFFINHMSEIKQLIDTSIGKDDE